ncbi:AAA family ATPase [Mycolicibacterium sp.]|uniref:AAA family ATPase n=1 Tax=Mycolicibacterium sp. TaxID=2320850 RepID=UPI0037CBBE30
MTAILITGMSGVGKSTVLTELARRGHETVDTDYGDWIHVVGGEPLWREELIDNLLDRPRAGPLFVQGTVANQVRFYPRFDAVVLLTAPRDVIFHRLRTRTGNDFGKTVDQLARISRDIEETEPLLRASATHELDTSGPLESVAAVLVKISEHAGR